MINCFISIASRFLWPWHRTGSDPPLVSITTFEKNRFVSISTDDTCAMWIDCSRRAEPLRRVVRHARRRDRDLRRKQVVPPAPAARPEHVLAGIGRPRITTQTTSSREHDERRHSHPDQQRVRFGHHSD